MKRTALLIVAIWISVSASPQDEKEFRTIFDNKDLRISGLGGPFMQFTTVAGEFGHLMGGGGGILINDFLIGGYGLGLTNSIPDYVGGDTDYRLTLGHGGFWIGYSLFGNLPVHANISTMIGWGEFGIIHRNSYYPTDRDNIFTLVPTVEVEINLTRYFRLGAGASYNYFTGVDEVIHGYSSRDLSSPAGFLSFKFGWF